MGWRKQAIILAMGVAALIRGQFALAANAENDLTTASMTGGASLLAAANWNPNHVVPTVGDDAVYTGTLMGTRIITAGSLTVGSFDLTATVTSGPFAIANNTTGAVNSTLTLGGMGDLGNAISGTSPSDLLYVAKAGTTFNLLGPNSASGSGVLRVVLGQSGNFNVVGTMSISAVISDGGSGFEITKTGSGALTLSAANTYTGTTTVSNGTLHLGRTTAGAAIAGNLAVSGGAVDYSTTTNEQIADTSNVTISSGAMALGARTQTFGNAGSASGGFTQTGGALSISSGALNLNRAPSISAGTITFTAGGAINVNDTLSFSGGTIDFQTASSATLALKASAGITYLATGTSTASITNSGGGSSNISLGTPSATRTFLINDSNTLAAGTEEMNIAAIISGGSGVTLNKDGAGELKIASASTYQGPTTVSGGKLTIAAGGSLTNTSSIGISSGAELSVNGSTNSSATVTVNSGGKLSGSGTVGSVALSGTVSSGNSVGILTTGNQTWNGGGKYVVELNTAQITAAAGSGFDQLQMSGLSASTLSSGSKFIVSVASLTTGTGTPFDGTSNYSWIIAKTSASHIAYPGGSGTSFFDAGLFSLDTSGFTGSNYASSSNNTSSSGTFALSDSTDGLGDDLLLNYNTAAPEPTSFFLFGAVVIPALLPRRRGLP